MDWQNLSPQVQSALIAGIVAIVTALVTTVLATPLRYWIDKLSLTHKLRSEYTYEQRKKWKDLVGRYKGRMLQTSEDLNHRIWNLYSNERYGWLRIGGRRSRIGYGYYFTTFVHRFISVYATIRQFEREQLYFDSAIADSDDFVFVHYIKAFNWAACSVELFRGLEYDISSASDHFYTESLRSASNGMIDKDERILSFDTLKSNLGKMKNLEVVIHYFDELNSSEKRFRWDRLVTIHLFLLAFMNKFGYRTQISSFEQFKSVAKRIKNPEVYLNIIAWIPRLGLSGHDEATWIEEACREAQIER